MRTALDNDGTLTPAEVQVLSLTNAFENGCRYCVAPGQRTNECSIGEARVSAVDVRDIASVAAIALTQGGHDVPPAAFTAALLSAGLPAWQVDGLIEDYAHYARGEAAAVLPTVREVTGRDPRDLTAFTRDYAEAFVRA